MSADDIANKFIDRTAEQELFEVLLRLEDDARVLVITDQGDRGKSTLLQRLKYICDWKTDPSVPVSLIALDQLATPEPYELVSQIQRDLGLPFPEFQRLSRGLLARDASLFLNASSYYGRVDAGSISGGVVAGVYAPAATSVTIERPDWNDSIEQHAREQAITAALNELRAICATSLVVLILDSFDEKGNSTVRDWAMRYLVRELCLDPARRAARLVLVVAGRSKPTFAGVPKYQSFIKTIDSLGLWEKNHLRDFLELHDIKLAPEDLGIVHAKLRNGFGLNGALRLAQVLRDQTP